MIRQVDAFCSAERAEHLHRQFQIDYVDDLVAVNPELAALYSHHNGIPFAVDRVPQHRRFKILVKRIVRRCAICIEAV